MEPINQVCGHERVIVSLLIIVRHGERSFGHLPIRMTSMSLREKNGEYLAPDNLS